jgi:hypothetical protein
MYYFCFAEDTVFTDDKHRRARRGRRSSMIITVGSTAHTSVLEWVRFVYARSLDFQLLEGDSTSCVVSLDVHRRRDL